MKLPDLPWIPGEFEIRVALRGVRGKGNAQLLWLNLNRLPCYRYRGPLPSGSNTPERFQRSPRKLAEHPLW